MNKVILNSIFLIFVFTEFSLCAPSLALAEMQTLETSGGTLSITLQAKGPTTAAQELAWIKSAAESVSAYYGHFPVSKVKIDVITEGKESKIGGTTWFGRKIQLRLGRTVNKADLDQDWVATHEMFHLAFPQINEDVAWMSEGMATYLEPFARARRQLIKPEQVWDELVTGLENGRPLKGDRGLNLTPTWGRTYWGGCGFWFMADALIREQTKNKKSIDTAMREILKAGGNGAAEWDESKVLEIADRATGTKVVSSLYHKMAEQPGWDGFPEILKKLGVSMKNEEVVFDEKAPLADIRRSMTAGNVF